MVSRLIRAVQYFQLDVLGAALVTRFSTSGDIDDITRAVNLFREALALDMANWMSTRILEAIDRCREFLRLQQLDNPGRHTTLYNLSSALCCLYSTQAFQFRVAAEGLFISLHDPADLSLIIEKFRLASQHPTQGFPERTIQASNWIHTAKQCGHDSALEAYSTFFELLDVIWQHDHRQLHGVKLLRCLVISQDCL
ncbi:hypothetical protein BDR07DRAFT_1490911 [Suillus spraguei]|nr:hypothetical protein BDR07DRAFT_1490911 [Suillus spraguei]